MDVISINNVFSDNIISNKDALQFANSNTLFPIILSVKDIDSSI